MRSKSDRVTVPAAEILIDDFDVLPSQHVQPLSHRILQLLTF
jgi:hypothetical protein